MTPTMRWSDRPPSRARRPAAGSRRGTGGGALPWALLALCLLLALSGTGYTIAWQERRLSRAHSVSVEAFYAADAALAGFLARWSGSTPPPPGPVGVPAGRARVEATALPAPGPGLALHRVRATSTSAPEGLRRQLQLVVLSKVGAGPPVPVPGTWAERFVF